MASCATGTREAPSSTWAPQTYILGADPVQICQADANRRGVLVVCDAASAGALHLGDKRRFTITTGSRSYPLAVGEGVTINTAGEVWALADVAGTGATVKVIEEFGAA